MENYIGQQIAYYRKKRGYTIRQLGELSGVHFANIGKIERGTYNPSIEVLERITKVLGCKIIITE